MHEHDWKPIQGECGQYECACNATGYRALDGSIRAHKYKPERARRWTAMSTTKRSDGRSGWRPSEDWDPNTTGED